MIMMVVMFAIWTKQDFLPAQVMMTTLMEKYGPYTFDCDKYTSIKRTDTLRNNMISITAVWLIIYGGFTIQ